MSMLRVFTILVALAFLLGGAASLFLDLEAPNRQMLAGRIVEDPGGIIKNMGIITIGYDLTTPAFRPCRGIAETNTTRGDGSCFGDEEKITWMIEDIPFPDSKDFLVLVPYWLLCILIARFLWRSRLNTGAKIAWIAFLFLFGSLLLWIVLKSVLYFGMLQAADDIGIKAEVIAAREEVIQATHDAGGLYPLLTLTLVLCLLTINGIWPTGGRG